MSAVDCFSKILQREPRANWYHYDRKCWDQRRYGYAGSIPHVDWNSIHVSRTFSRSRPGVEVVGTDSLDSITENDKFSEYFSAPYYKPIPDNQLRSDVIDRALGCVGMHWNKTPGETVTSSPSKDSGLVPASTIRGSILIVQQNVATRLVHLSDSLRTQVSQVVEVEPGWHNQSFYRSHVFQNGEFHKIESKTLPG